MEERQRRQKYLQKVCNNKELLANSSIFRVPLKEQNIVIDLKKGKLFRYNDQQQKNDKNEIQSDKKYTSKQQWISEIQYHNENDQYIPKKQCSFVKQPHKQNLFERTLYLRKKQKNKLQKIKNEHKFVQKCLNSKIRQKKHKYINNSYAKSDLLNQSQTSKPQCYLNRLHPLRSSHNNYQSAIFTSVFHETHYKSFHQTLQQLKQTKILKSIHKQDFMKQMHKSKQPNITTHIDKYGGALRTTSPYIPQFLRKLV